MNNMNLRRPNDCGFRNGCTENMNTRNCSCGHNSKCDADSSLNNDPLSGLSVGIGYVPWQQWGKVYDLAKGLNQGTIFPVLDLPFYGCVPRNCGRGHGGAL